METRSLIMTLKEPLRLKQTNICYPDKRLLFAGQITSRPSSPPWPACADLLINTNESKWVGVCYRVGKEYQTVVKYFCERMSDQIITYNDLSSIESYKMYKDFGTDVHWVEIKWSSLYADRVEVEQLDSGFWFYVEPAKELEAVAFALEDVDDVLKNYSFDLPELGSVQIFEPVFIEELVKESDDNSKPVSKLVERKRK